MMNWDMIATILSAISIMIAVYTNTAKTGHSQRNDLGIASKP